MFTVRALSLLTALVLLTTTGLAQAKTSLQIEVREPQKARLVSADIWLKTLAGKQVREYLAAGGRLRVDNAPAGTFNMEVRTRTGNLEARSRIVIKPNQLTRSVVRVQPAKKSVPKVQALSSSRKPAAGVTRRSTPPTQKRTARPRARKGTTSVHVPKVTASSAGTSKDWGKGKTRVCRGDVFDSKGRRVTGRIQVYSGTKGIGFSTAAAGYFSLYDLSPGTYKLKFATLDNKRRAEGNVAVIKGKLIKAVLKVVP
jgi:hypothetical protein